MESKENNTPNLRWWRYWRIVQMVLAHAVCFTIALFLSFILNNDMRVSPDLLQIFLPWLLITLIVKLVIFGFLHQYYGYWKYASVTDLLSIIKGSHLSTLLLVAGWYVAMNVEVIRKDMGKMEMLPQAVMLLDWAATIVVLCGVRLAIRLYFEETQAETGGGVKRIFIVGAGNAGEVLLREIHRMSSVKYEVTGFIDDDPRKIGARIHGVPVLGATEQIKDLAPAHSVDEIIIAMLSATHKQLKRVIEQCSGAKLHFSIVPDLVAIASGQVRVSQIREVDINDLLGRDPVTLDCLDISQFIKDKTVMITGAGGSIGSEMCRQVGNFQPKRLLLIEQAENSLFFIERELRQLFPKMDIQAHICDIVDKVRVDYLFNKYQPEVVIHAAAHKHVPLMETDPGEAVKNNVCGTRNIAEAAHRFQASHFVMISTDKAVNPTSVMGSTKRIAEMSIQCLNQRSQTDFITVRFGNVLGSNGSVIPIFKQQIAAGGPVTVTHPEMCRYFMTIPEASQLVLQAAAMGKGGEIFLLDMGEPVKIVDLARDLITLSGFRPGDDIEITFSGMRPGEKLFEELSITGEDMVPTRHPKIGIWKNVVVPESELDAKVAQLLAAAQNSDRAAVISKIKEIIPDYCGDKDSELLRENHLKANGKSGVTTSVKP